MGFVMAIAPVAVVGGIAVFFIERLKQKHKKGNLGKKKTKGAQMLLDSLIPFGMLIGCAAGVIFGMFSSVSILFTVSVGAGIGYLFGYFAYEFIAKVR